MLFTLDFVTQNNVYIDPLAPPGDRIPLLGRHKFSLLEESDLITSSAVKQD
jgi:hypothetical protein